MVMVVAERCGHSSRHGYRYNADVAYCPAVQPPTLHSSLFILVSVVLGTSGAGCHILPREWEWDMARGKDGGMQALAGARRGQDKDVYRGRSWKAKRGADHVT